MEKRKSISILISFFLVLGNSCLDKKKKNDINFLKQFIKKIELIEKSPDDSIINIADMTSFEWEKLYVFKPYTQIKEIHSKLGFIWNDAELTLIHQSDEFNLLVFVKSNKIIHFVNIPRNHGDFYKLRTNGPFTRDKSFFIVRKELFGTQYWTYLYPIE
jgi:hypothetical protein